MDVASLGGVGVLGIDHVQVAAPAGCEAAARAYCLPVDVWRIARPGCADV